MKKVLIITYYWPPAGGPGVQRVLKFAKYLPEFGWEPIILTVKNGEYPAIDESLLEEISPDLKVYKTKSIEPFSIYKSLSGQKGTIPTHVLSKSKNETFIQKFSKWLRANVFIPDARVGWISSIVKEGKKIIDKENPQIIFSSSPPHSLQIGAMKLAKKSGLKWVADFRDPWTDGFWQKSLPRTNYSVKKDLSLEKKVLSSANAVLSVSESVTKLFQRKVENDYHVIPNGYDENDFQNITKSKPDEFTILYAGSLRQSQIPVNLFTSLSELKKEKQIENLQLKFIGTIHPDALEFINKYNINDLVRIENYIPHAQLLQQVVNADILLLTIPNTSNNEGILTGKLFEYIASKNFILGFGPKKGDASKIISSLNSGVMLEYSDNPKEIILSKYHDWKDGKSLASPINSEDFTRKNLTKKLSEIFESLL